MYRGSSFLLQHSVKQLQPAVLYINTLDKSVWSIDVDNYSEENMEIIINIYQEIKKLLISNGNADLTLITKILLAVFGFIPAFDKYFCDTFRSLSDGMCGFRKVNKISLGYIHNFYQENKYSIDNLSKSTFTTDFVTEKGTNINYPKAKIIDMYGFNEKQYLENGKGIELKGEEGDLDSLND
jgi:hypothetical protein